MVRITSPVGCAAVLLGIFWLLNAMKFLGKYRNGCWDASAPDDHHPVHSVGNGEN